MKKVSAVLLLLSVVLTGCAAPTISQQRDALLKRAPNDYAEPGGNSPVKIDDIRSELISSGWETDDFLRRLTSKCYNLSYYKSGECTLDFYYKELKSKEREQQDNICDKQPACVRDRSIRSAESDLNRVYYLIMARNPYDQAEFDLNIRALCKAAGVGQRRGITLDKIKYDVAQEPGLSPEVRSQFSDVAVSCWELSKQGVLDGTTKINNAY